MNPFQHIEKVVKQKDLQQQLVDAKLHQAQELLKESEERHDREKEFVMSTSVQCNQNVWTFNINLLSFPFLTQLLKEAVESQRMCELMKQQEVHLKQQVSQHCYSSVVLCSHQSSDQGGVCASILVITVHREV